MWFKQEARQLRFSCAERCGVTGLQIWPDIWIWLSHFVMLRALRSESYYERWREICSNLHCLEIVCYLRHNLLTVCLIYRKHGVIQTWDYHLQNGDFMDLLSKYSSCSLRFSELSMPSVFSVFSEIGHWHNRGFMQTALTLGRLELTNSETFWNIDWEATWAYSLSVDSLPP